MRLIDANAYEHAVQGNPYVSDSMKTYVRCSIQSQPTIDAVPVIRCKDCVYFTPEKSGEHWNICRFYDAPKTAEGYCNDAEPKDG